MGSDEEVFVHDSASIDEHVDIDSGSKVWHNAHVMEGASIGANCTLGQNVFVGKNVSIGNEVKIQNNVSVYRGVTLKDGVFCGPSMVFTNVNTPRSRFSKDEEDYEETVVGEGATIGANVTVICGNHIGDYAMIGAGSVITSLVSDHAFVYGNPARQHGFACVCGELYRKKDGFSEWVCPDCGVEYTLQNKNLVREQ